MQFWIDFWNSGKRDILAVLFFAGMLILAKLGFGGLEISPRWRLPADIALYVGFPGSIIWEFVKFMRNRKLQERKKNAR